MIPGIPAIFNKRSNAEIKRKLDRAVLDLDAAPVISALYTNFVVHLDGARDAEKIANCMRRIVLENGCKVNGEIDKNKSRKRKNEHSDVILNVSSVTERFVAASINDLCRALSAIMVYFADYVSDRAMIRPIAALDEMELPIWGHIPANLRDLPIGHYARFTVAPSKQVEGVHRVLRFHHGVLAWPSLHLKLPIHFRPHCRVDLETGTLFDALPGHADVVKEFLGDLDKLRVQPDWVYMDRGFFAWATLAVCLKHHEKWMTMGQRVDFMLPTPATGQDRLEATAPADLGKKRKRKAILNGRPSIKELIRMGKTLPMRGMKSNSEWFYRQFKPNDENGPYVPTGYVLLVVNAPKGDVEHANNDDAPTHTDGTRSFATYSTRPVTDNTAYSSLRHYFSRNYAEAFVQDYKGDFKMCESPDYARRFASIVMAVIAKCVFGAVRQGVCNRRGNWDHGTYTWKMFCEDAQPAACQCNGEPN